MIFWATPLLDPVIGHTFNVVYGVVATVAASNCCCCCDVGGTVCTATAFVLTTPTALLELRNCPPVTAVGAPVGVAVTGTAENASPA